MDGLRMAAFQPWLGQKQKRKLSRPSTVTPYFPSHTLFFYAAVNTVSPSNDTEAMLSCLVELPFIVSRGVFLCGFHFTGLPLLYRINGCDT